MGEYGLGYYVDKYYSFEPTSNAQQPSEVHPEASDLQQKPDSGKRKLEGIEEEEVGDSKISRLLAEAEQSGISQLDAAGLKSLLVNFEKKITKNQKQRMKYPNEPEKFMESEVELHDEIQELHAVAASPELYSILVDTKAVNSILGMITHENTDISIAAVSLLQEMTDVDISSEEEKSSVERFVNTFIEGQGLELIVQNIARLDEANDEDAQGVHNTLAIIDNLVEILPEVGKTVCRRTNILKYLLQRVKPKKFDAVKLYASELLSILLQSSPHSDAIDSKESLQIQLCNLKLSDKEDVIDGMDSLLQSIASYRKKEVTAADEQECVENLFLSLCSVLMARENQFKFLACEGFELMLRCLKEQQYAAGCAINAIKFSVMRNKACCEKFIDVGGLKYVFALLTGRGVKKALKRKGSGEKRNVEETAISIIAQLCSQLHSSKTNDYSMRLLHKFMENEKEKLERCAELFVKYFELLEQTDERLETQRQELEDEGDEEALAEFEDEEYIHSERLDGGLFLLQELAVIISFATIFDSSKECLVRAESKLSAASFHRTSNGQGSGSELSLLDVLAVLRSHAAYLLKSESADELENSSSPAAVPTAGSVSDPVDIEKDLRRKYKNLLTEWSAALATLIE